VVLKERFRKALQKKTRRGFSGYPVATVVAYGPDDKVATKATVAIIAGESQEPVALERWFSEKGDVRRDFLIQQQILEFIKKHGAKSVVMTDRIIGCPHEEGKDYPAGEKCPHCPFWANRDRWTGEVTNE
jgi:hypothetical protein